MNNPLLARAKRTASTRSLRSTFASENGAIDLASIMVGVIVIGLIGGVIAATVFTVIPWAQDNAAKQQLAEVHTAENVFSGFSASPDASASLVGASTLRAAASGGNYADAATLGSKDLFTAPGSVSIAVGTDATCYVAAATSASGHQFFITDAMSVPAVYSATTSASCAGVDLAAVVAASAPASSSQEWVLQDANLRAQVKTILGVDAASKLTPEDAARFGNTQGAQLDFSNVTTAAGLEKATNLTQLNQVYLPKAKDTLGFQNIVSIEQLNLQGNDTFTRISGFTSLQSAGEVIVNQNTKLQTVDTFPLLETVGGSASSNVQFLTNPKLTSIGGFPKLRTVSGMVDISEAPLLAATPSFPELISTSQFSFSYDDALNSIGEAPKLQGGFILVNGDATLQNVPGFAEFNSGSVVLDSLPELTSVGSFPKLDSSNIYVSNSPKYAK